MANNSSPDFEEVFPHLSRAPIVEAAVEIRARAETTWNDQDILNRIKSDLPDYPKVLSQREIRHELRMGPDSSTESKLQDLGMKGFRFESSDGLQIGQFNRDGYVFSRLAPYEGWEEFNAEWLRLWRISFDLFKPSQIQRIGLRFINRIQIDPNHNSLEYYLAAPPQNPQALDFPFLAFFHRDSFSVPGYPYVVNVVKTVQPQESTGGLGPGLIFDIDIVSDQPLLSAEQDLLDRLDEMRWLKNRFFFSSITPQLLELIK